MKRITVVPQAPPSRPEAQWAAVLRRDRSFDGRFVYAVISTGVFCRPSCPSRRPRADRVRFFDTASEAQGAGFRPCRRCHPTRADALPATAEAIRRASRYLEAHADDVVPLATLARDARLSPSHFQREFKRALGLSPREYQAACRADRFRQHLRDGHDVAAATYEAGYGSPSRVYEAAPTGRGMPPATYRRGGAGATIGFTTIGTPLGWLLVAATDKGICAVKLGDSAPVLEQDLRREFPAATIASGRFVPREWVTAIVESLRGGRQDLSLPLDVRGTAFQWLVWRELQRIPAGETRSYSDVARSIGQPRAVRAVASACARNPVCLVVPCHRVVGSSGAPGGYRWGAQRKQRLLAAEQPASRNRTPPGRRRHESK